MTPPLAIGRSNKYGAKKAEADGYTFDSLMEQRRYFHLKFMQNAGLIYELEVHPAFRIELNGIPICGVELDFAYIPLSDDYELKRSFESGKVYEDVKGRDNHLSKLKRKLVQAQYGITVNVVKQNGKGWKYELTGRGRV